MKDITKNHVCPSCDYDDIKIEGDFKTRPAKSFKINKTNQEILQDIAEEIPEDDFEAHYTETQASAAMDEIRIEKDVANRANVLKIWEKHFFIYGWEKMHYFVEDVLGMTSNELYEFNESIRIEREKEVE